MSIFFMFMKILFYVVAFACWIIFVISEDADLQESMISMAAFGIMSIASYFLEKSCKEYEEK